MTLQEFNNLNMTKRSDLLWDWGYYVSERKTVTTKIVLFAFSNFFAEITFANGDEKTLDVQGLPALALHPDYSLTLREDNPFLRAVPIDLTPLAA
jgi:hypothetical protein